MEMGIFFKGDSASTSDGYESTIDRLKRAINGGSIVLKAYPNLFLPFLINFLISELGLYVFIPNKYFLINSPWGKIYLNLRESKQMRQRALGTYEYMEVDWWKKIIKPGMVGCDIGVNKGYYSLFFAKLVGYRGRVLSFEPDAENCVWIRKTLSANFYKNIKLYQIALYNKTGESNFFKGHFSGHHSLIIDFGLGMSKVKTRKLDDVLKEENINKIDFMKIDVEGAEVEVLEGAQSLLKQQKPKLMIDIHNIDKKKFFNLLKNHGYKIYQCSHNFRFDKELVNENEFLLENPSTIYAK